MQSDTRQRGNGAGEETHVLLPSRRKVLLGKLQRLLDLSLAYELDEPLLLEVEREVLPLLQNLTRGVEQQRGGCGLVSTPHAEAWARDTRAVTDPLCSAHPCALRIWYAWVRTSGLRSLARSIASSTFPCCTATRIESRSSSDLRSIAAAQDGVRGRAHVNGTLAGGEARMDRPQHNIMQGGAAPPARTGAPPSPHSPPVSSLNTRAASA